MLSSRLQRHDPTAAESVESFIALSDEGNMSLNSSPSDGDTALFVRTLFSSACDSF